MTPGQIDKEKADKINQTQTIQSDKADIEESLVQGELGKSKPIDATPPKESDSQYAKKVGDFKKVQAAFKEKGIDPDNVDKMPLMESDKDKITEAVKGMYGKELANGIQNLSNSITAPKNIERGKLDQKALMESEKRQRRARFADALSAFGDGLQGKTINTEDFLSTKIQRQRDKQFQDFKDVTEQNQKTKYLWENQTRKELVDWADEQAKNERLDSNTRAKFKQVADKYAADADYKNEQLKIAKERNRIAAAKGGKVAKEDRPVIIQTAQKTYELKPEEAAFYKGEILKNAATLRAKYPGWFTENQSEEKFDSKGNTIPGVKSYKLNPEVNDVDMIRAYLENKEPGHLNEEAYEQNKASYFDKYRKEKGLSTAPASNTAKPQPQKPKANPLGLRL